MSEDTTQTTAPDSERTVGATTALHHILGNAHKFKQVARDFKHAAQNMGPQQLNAALGYAVENDDHGRYKLLKNSREIRVKNDQGGNTNEYGEVMQALRKHVSNDVEAITHIIANAPTSAKTAHMDLRHLSDQEQRRFTQLPKALDAARSVLDSASQAPVASNDDRKKVSQAIQDVQFLDASSEAISGIVNSITEHNTGMTQRNAQFTSDAQEDAARDKQASTLKAILQSSREHALESDRGYNRYRDTAKKASEERLKTMDTKATLEQLAADPAASKDGSSRSRQ